jgi:surface antigen
MKLPLSLCSIIAGIAALGTTAESMVQARTAELSPSQANELPPYLPCVPYAREVSGIAIFGDAHTWWDQAEGSYPRGRDPRIGAVMAFVATAQLPLGHVATVAKVLDKRTVLLDHANWSPINGRRGQIERGVKAVDVSAKGDWSEVRVWYAPLQDLGTTRWPVAGFIYADGKDKRTTAEVRPAAAPAPKSQPAAPVGTKPSRDFRKFFAAVGEPASPPPVKRPSKIQPAAAQAAPTAPPLARKKAQPAPQSDPYAAVLSQYD